MSINLRFTAIVLIFNLYAILVLSEGEEQIPIKSFSTKSRIIIGPTSYLAVTTEEKDLMPGNDGFGFFYLDKNQNEGVCRLRLKMTCDRGLNFFTPLKNKRINVVVNNIMFSQKTNIDGILDLLFRCQKSWKDLESTLNYNKYNNKFILKDSSEEIKVPDAECK